MIRSPIDHLETIWQKPESTRKVIAAIAVSLCTVVIVSIWLMTFSLETAEVASADTAVAEDSPLRVIWDTVKDKISINPIFK